MMKVMLYLIKNPNSNDMIKEILLDLLKMLVVCVMFTIVTTTCFMISGYTILLIDHYMHLTEYNESFKWLLLIGCGIAWLAILFKCRDYMEKAGKAWKICDYQKYSKYMKKDEEQAD